MKSPLTLGFIAHIVCQLSEIDYTFAVVGMGAIWQYHLMLFLPIYLYALYASDGVCHYVGQTAKPHIRQRRHRSNYPSLTFRLLRCCPVEDAQRLETQIIKAYWKRGEAGLNNNVSGQGVAYRHGIRFRNAPVVWVETGHIFKSIPSAAKFFGLIPDTVRGILFKGAKPPEGITLKLFSEKR